MNTQAADPQAIDGLLQKQERLVQQLHRLGSVAVAFSSGADSTYLLKVAHDTLGDNAIAVTARSCSFPERELEQAKAFCASEKIAHWIVDSEELAIDGFRQNPTNRCYLCKRELFTKILEIASERGIAYVAEGSNVDDTGDYRPGLTAIAELGIQSPLRAAGLTKAEIRELSRRMGLPTWNKPSFACLASRFVYGETISEEKLQMVDKAEQLLLDMGFRQVRVRIHRNLARIELEDGDIQKFCAPPTRQTVTQRLHELGFSYVTLDLDGYQMGSMNRDIAARVQGEPPAPAGV